MNEIMGNAVPEGLTLNESYGVMHGKVNGYVVLVNPLAQSGQYKVTLQIDVEQNEHKEEFLNYLNTLEETYGFVAYAGYHMNLVTVSVKFEEDNDKKNMTQLLQDITNACSEYQLHSCCAACGSEKDVKVAAVDGISKVMCKDCLDRIATGTAKQDGSQSPKENFVLGFLGALAGAVIGSVLWVLIGNFGFIAGIAGYAIVFCSVKGYEMLGRRVSKKAVVSCLIISFLMIAAAEGATMVVTLYQELNADYAITIVDTIKMLPELLRMSEFRIEILKDLAVGYVFAIWASYSFVKHIWGRIEAENKEHTVVSL